MRVQMSWEAREGIGSHGVGTAGSCSLKRVLGTDSGPMPEQHDAGPSLQLRPFLGFETGSLTDQGLASVLVTGSLPFQSWGWYPLHLKYALWQVDMADPE